VVALTTLAQDLETGDLATDARGIGLAFGADAVVVLVSNACRQQPGDDKRLPARGIPLETLLGKGASEAAIRSLFVRKAAQVSDVTAVPACTSKTSGDAVTLDMQVETDELSVSTSFTVGT